MNNNRLDKTIIKKLWFVNILLACIWATILFVDITPWVSISNEYLKTMLYTLVGVIPAFFIAESIGLWKHYKIVVKNPYEKEKDH